MVIELKNEQLTVQFSEFGGALSSIKDKDGEKATLFCTIFIKCFC